MLQIIQGDCLAILPTLPEKSIQCCVTSPPYWGLRDYGTAQWEGGDDGCDHKPTREWLDHNFNGKSSCISGKGSQSATGATRWYEKICSCKCGARRIDSQLGLESTPEEYITKMVSVFREVWRVMRDDGTLWLNLGDSYAGSMKGSFKSNEAFQRYSDKSYETGNTLGQRARTHYSREKMHVSGLKHKDLCGIPWRLALALQADGWYLRSDIIWAKPNPMPESVTDRPTKSHEYIFLLTKQERYFYDAEAIRETAEKTGTEKHLMGGNGERAGTREGLRGKGWSEFRNKRSVWMIATQPYAEAHFATFPEDLVKPCILAGSKPGDTVLDPFGGSGTVGKVALELGRRAVLIELNPEYIKLAERRCDVTPGFPYAI